MSKRRNISGGDLDVPLLDRVVAADEVVEVPDFQPAHNPQSSPGDPDYLAIIWPPDKWEDVPDPVVAPEPKRARPPAAKPELPAPEPVPDVQPDPAPDVQPQPAAPAAPSRPVSSDPRER